MRHYLLVGILCPAVLFTFAILFGSESYQLWWEKFLYELTNRFLFTHYASGTLLGPLWREETLGGNIWAVNMGPSPLALEIVAGRLFQLSPFGVDLIGHLVLYFAAAVFMHLYLHRALLLSKESATISSTMFAVTVYWIATTEGNPEVPMAVSGLPALLLLSHRIDTAAKAGGAELLRLVTVFALLLYAIALHSSVNTLPIMLLFVAVYSGFVFWTERSIVWVFLAIGLGMVLYSPFLWHFIEAAGISRRYVGSEFYSQYTFDFKRVFTESIQVLTRMAAGYNQYGIYLVTAVGVLVWICCGPSWKHEQTKVRRILQVALGIFVAGCLIELFHEDINYAKQNIPLLGGWNIWRVAFFSSFGSLTLLAWMLDRSLLYPGQCPSSHRRNVLRVALIVIGVLGSLRIGYSIYRTRLVSDSMFLQKLVLYTYLVLCAVATLALLAFLYRRVSESRNGSVLCRTDSDRFWCVTLIVLSVALITSVHAYRPGVLPVEARSVIHPLPIMTYFQRYTVPDELAAIKQLNTLNDRVLDLTRPWYDSTKGVLGEAPLLALAGLRIPSGYNALFPAWYYRFIRIGINGKPGSLERNLVVGKAMLQVEDTGETNFEGLGLLDVRYVLAFEGMHFPGYAPVVGFHASGKVLHAAEESRLVAPVFVSPNVQCFPNDVDALHYVHWTHLAELQARAVLITDDAEAASIFCAKREGSVTVPKSNPARIEVRRGTDEVDIEVESGTGGILTLTDTYYPGWRVFVDGTEQVIVRTYTTLRGVQIEPGRHSVEFIYDPRVFHVLFKLSNVLLILLLVTVFVTWRKEQSKVSSRETLSHVQP